MNAIRTSDDLEPALTLRLGRDPAEVRRSRVWASEIMHALGCEETQIEDVEVMISELVANTIRHTHAGAEATMRAEPGKLVFEVLDHEPTFPTIPPMDPLRGSGNGLRIIEACSDAWGARPAPDASKVVWFEVER